MAVSTAIVFVRSVRQIKTKCEKAEILWCATVDTAGHQLACCACAVGGSVHQFALESCAVGRSGSVVKSDEAAVAISALNYVASDVCVDFV